MHSSLMTWESYQLYQKITESKEPTRRDFLKKLVSTAATAALAGTALKSLYNMIFKSYSDEDNDFHSASDLRFSKQGLDFVESAYRKVIPNVDDYLKIAEVDVMKIFRSLNSAGINIKMNQKMYDAVVLIALRYGSDEEGKNFKNSEFLKLIKKSKFSEAIEKLKEEQVDTWYIPKLKSIKEYEIELLSSFVDNKKATQEEEEEDEEEDETEDKPTTRAGTGQERKTKKSEKLVRLKDTNYSRVRYDLDKTQNDKVNKALLDDLQKAAEKADIIVTITTAKSGHSPFTIFGSESRHWKNIAVDIAILNGIGSGNAKNAISGNPKFRELGNRLKDELVKLGYVWNTEYNNKKAILWQTNKGGNHFNHLHVSRKLD